MSSLVGTKIFFVSVLGIPIVYVANNLVGKLKITDPITIAVMGLGIITSIVLLMIALTRRHLRNNSKKYHFYGNHNNRLPFRFTYPLSVFSCLCFCSVCSIIMGLELEGLICGFVNNILKHGDVHLRSAFGAMLCHWNGIVVYAISVTIISAITWK